MATKLTINLDDNAAPTFDELANSMREAGDEADNLGDDLGGLGEDAEEIQSRFEEFRGVLDDMGIRSLVDLKAAFDIVAGTIRNISHDLIGYIDEWNLYQDAVAGAEAFTGKNRTALEAMALQLRSASSNALSLTESLQLVNRGLAGGVEFEKLARAVEFASQQAKAFGDDASANVQRVITALVQGSPDALREIGLLTGGLDEARAHFELVEGAGIGAFDALGEVDKKAVVLRASMARLDVVMEQFAAAGLDAKNEMDELRGAFDNLQFQMAEIVGESSIPEFFRELAAAAEANRGTLSELANWLGDVGIELSKIAQIAPEVQGNVEQLDESVFDFSLGFTTLSRAIYDVIANLARFRAFVAETYAEMIDGYVDIGHAIGVVSDQEASRLRLQAEGFRIVAAALDAEKDAREEIIEVDEKGREQRIKDALDRRKAHDERLKQLADQRAAAAEAADAKKKADKEEELRLLRLRNFERDLILQQRRDIDEGLRERARMGREFLENQLRELEVDQVEREDIFRKVRDAFGDRLREMQQIAKDFNVFGFLGGDGASFTHPFGGGSPFGFEPEHRPQRQPLVFGAGPLATEEGGGVRNFQPPVLPGAQNFEQDAFRRMAKRAQEAREQFEKVFGEFQEFAREFGIDQKQLAEGVSRRRIAEAGGDDLTREERAEIRRQAFQDARFGRLDPQELAGAIREALQEVLDKGGLGIDEQRAVLEEFAKQLEQLAGNAEANDLADRVRRVLNGERIPQGRGVAPQETRRRVGDIGEDLQEIGQQVGDAILDRLPALGQPDFDPFKDLRELFSDVGKFFEQFNVELPNQRPGEALGPELPRIELGGGGDAGDQLEQVGDQQKQFVQQVLNNENALINFGARQFQILQQGLAGVQQNAQRIRALEQQQEAQGQRARRVNAGLGP
ncbi:hypothetical protein Pan216_16090 [Planctomycetes bacterium Pan216]|uniref:Uncharacterized protein n=1 Tax=Kolteria novifilia TaxID=2527975 RepID=A0A518B1A5_9BACT|nr:hypothetical protein Pan216_16090 [Planctomycetes bacterium Pan216]